MAVNINDYTCEQTCIYKERKYHVRDNGAVYRVCKKDGIVRKNDEVWSFGRVDSYTGYMLIGQERVHRIVCTAFHGEPVGDRNVVDHIDTNRCNNRPENLRWVTKLENTLLNPITRAKVELICGSIEAFLENSKLLYGHESENPNFVWMRAVTKEEAQIALKNLREWAEKPLEERKSKGQRKGPGEWIFSEKEISEAREWNGDEVNHRYKSYAQQVAEIEEENQRIREEQYGLKKSLTPGALQLNWKVPSDFPFCPVEHSATPLQDYLANLKVGDVFCKNDVYESIFFKADLSDDGKTLAVICTSESVKGGDGYVLTTITYEDGHFIHENQGSFFEEIGAEKYFTLALGRKWTGGDVFDDYC